MTTGTSHDSTTDGTVERLTAAMASGLHDLANDAGELERAMLERDLDTLDDETHRALDQAHSNASALLATLDRIGLG